MNPARYAVRRLNWKEPAAGRYFRLPGWADVSQFDSLEQATAERARLEEAARRVVNPFACAESFFELSTLPGYMLYDWLLDGGVEPPTPDVPLAEWGAWWDAAKPRMSPDQLARAWAGFDKLRFYEVSEQHHSISLQVVLEVYWGLNNERYVYEAMLEGGRPLCATHSLESANLIHGQVTQDLRAQYEMMNDYYPPSFVETNSRLQAARDPFRDPGWDRNSVNPEAEWPFAQLAAAPVIGDPGRAGRAGRVYLVQRLSWAWEPCEAGGVWCCSVPDPNWVDGVPVAAYLERRAAESAAWELDYVARLYLNPFRFGHPVELSSVAETGFRSVLNDAGLDPPVAWRQTDFRDVIHGGTVSDAWVRWWNATADQMSSAQRETVWDLLDQLRFYQVVEIALED